MKVKQNIKGEVYKNLIRYAVGNNDIVTFTYRPNQHENENMKIIHILSKLGLSKKYIINNYSDEFIGLFFEKYKNNRIIFDDVYIEDYEKNITTINNSSYKKFKANKKNRSIMESEYEKFGIKLNLKDLSYNDYKNVIIYDQRFNYIYSNLKIIFYDYIVNTFLSKYKYDIIHEEKSIYKNKNGNEILISIKYYFKLSEELKINILRKKSIYDWCFPMSIEDIEFYKDGKCWLLSVSHEEILDIFCRSEKEYEYLKSIGIEFVDENYIPLKKQHTIYKNYNDTKNTIYYI